MTMEKKRKIRKVLGELLILVLLCACFVSVVELKRLRERNAELEEKIRPSFDQVKNEIVIQIQQIPQIACCQTLEEAIKPEKLYKIGMNFFGTISSKKMDNVYMEDMDNPYMEIFQLEESSSNYLSLVDTKIVSLQELFDPQDFSKKFYFKESLEETELYVARVNYKGVDLYFAFLK